MTGWKPASIVAPNGWEESPSDACYNSKPAYLRMSVCTSIILKRTAPTIVEYSPTKIPELYKGTLFDLLPLNIINDIDTCIIGLKYNDKHKAVTS